MNKFDFYKKREISSYLSDTFVFFRIYMKNFFKNYAIINGPIILSFIVISAIFLGLGSIKEMIGAVKHGEVLPLIMNIAVSILIICLLGILVAVFVSCFSFAYAKLCEKFPERNDFTASELMQNIKSILGRTFLFYLISLVVCLIPLLLAYSALLYISTQITGLGGLLQFVLQTALSLIVTIWIGQASLLYIKDGEDYFASLSKGFEILKEGFWHKIGATWIMSIIVQVASIIITILPIIITIVQIYSGIETKGGIFLVCMWGLVLTTIFIASNLTFFLQMIIHYSSKNHQKTYHDIDQIGQNTDE